MSKDSKVTAFIVGGFLVLVIAGIIIYSVASDKLKYPKDAKWATNDKTLKMVDQLHPKVKQRVANFFTDIEKKLGLYAIGTSGLRTSEQQANLNLQNVANADAGLSDHEYGFAIDINIYNKEGESLLRKASSKSAWISSGVVDIARKYGLKWGGDFKNYHDPIHFYDDFDIPASEMKERKLAGKVDKNGYLLV